MSKIQSGYTGNATIFVRTMAYGETEQFKAISHVFYNFLYSPILKVDL